jgi:hypothetical protein
LFAETSRFAVDLAFLGCPNQDDYKKKISTNGFSHQATVCGTQE